MSSEQAQVVLGVDDLDGMIGFLDGLGFRLMMIMPADRPRLADMEGFGLSIRLDAGADATAVHLRLPVDDGSQNSMTVAPNGATIEFVPATVRPELPPLDASFVLNRVEQASWSPGRAGMSYRDLLPGRQGGRFIASHIHIPDGGPVPDYVHHHAIRFQMIFCYRGWARLVYEDQGPPFRFEAGDCVLQPPHIRHQVLETSSEFDVVEIGCPAEHETYRDHELSLPTGAHRPDRRFGGQLFVHHRRAGAPWRPWSHDGYHQRDFGFGEATDGLAGARVVRSDGSGRESSHRHDGELLFWFLLRGTAELDDGTARHALGPSDSVALAAGEDYALLTGPDLEFLEVSLPAKVVIGH